MKIILNNDEKYEALKNELDEVQKRCTVRTIDVDDVKRIISRVEKSLYGVSKKALKGVSFYYDGAEHFPNAYQYTPKSTHISAEYNGKCWVIRQIERMICPNRENNIKVNLTEEAKQAILRVHSSFRV